MIFQSLWSWILALNSTPETVQLHPESSNLISTGPISLNSLPVPPSVIEVSGNSVILMYLASQYNSLERDADCFPHSDWNGFLLARDWVCYAPKWDISRTFQDQLIVQFSSLGRNVQKTILTSHTLNYSIWCQYDPFWPNLTHFVTDQSSVSYHLLLIRTTRVLSLTACLSPVTP